MTGSLSLSLAFIPASSKHNSSSPLPRFACFPASYTASSSSSFLSTLLWGCDLRTLRNVYGPPHLVNTTVEERRGWGGEGCSARVLLSEDTCAVTSSVRWDRTGQRQVNGFMSGWGYILRGSAGVWGDQNDVISKACSIWLDSAV